MSGMLRRKPLSAILDGKQEQLARHFGFWSLLAVGVGGAIGSGIFVLSGEIASTMAGPASVVSWALAGFVSLLTALCYAELSSKIPTTGSTYIFAYHALGEVYAHIAAWLLSFEYAGGSSAVARSWGDKLAFWVGSIGIDPSCQPVAVGDPVSCWVNSLGGTSINLGGFLVSTAAVLVVLRGGEMGRKTINVLVMLKVSLVVFVISVGTFYVDRSNFIPFLPSFDDWLAVRNASGILDPNAEYTGGTSGVLLGATVAFFGFIGFDEVTCLSSEAIKPAKTVPAAVMWTIACVMFLYMLAALTLTGMVPFHKISPEEGFGSAFQTVGATWAAQVIMAGELLVVLPTVVLVSLYPQPLLFYAMAKDRMLPSLFAKVTKKGVLFWGSLYSGLGVIGVATFIPFGSLNEMISGAVLLSFVFANCSVLLLRYSDVENEINNPVYMRQRVLSDDEVLSGGSTINHVEEWQRQNELQGNAPFQSTNASMGEETTSRTVERSRFSINRLLAVYVSIAGGSTFLDAIGFAKDLSLVIGALCCTAILIYWKLYVPESEHSSTVEDNIGHEVVDDLLASTFESSSSHTQSTSTSTLRERRPSFEPVLQDQAGSLDSLNAKARFQQDSYQSVSETFQVPWMPFVPGIAIFFNFFLIVQLPSNALGLVVLAVLLSFVTYRLYGYRKSAGRSMWEEPDELFDESKHSDELEPMEQHVEMVTV